MTQAIDAAVRAICQEQQSYCEWPKCKEVCAFWEHTAMRALCAALPAEPTPELIEAIAEAEDDEDVYRALRAHLLGEDA